jgi:hypothetical protein
MRQYEENGYLITEYDSGSIVKSLISEVTPDLPKGIKLTIEDRIEEINEQNLTIMDALATIYEEFLLREEV